MVEKIKNKKLCFISIIIIFIVSFGLYYTNSYKTSNKVFVETNVFSFSPKISGKIIELNIENNSEVKKGEIIAIIDSKKYKDDLNNSKLKLIKVQSDLEKSKNIVDKMKILTLDKKNEINNAKMQLESANSDYIIYKNAYSDGSVTEKDLNNAIKNLDIARLNYEKAQNNLENSKKALNLILVEESHQNEQLKKIITEYEQAKLNLSYTTLISPIDGNIKDLKIKNDDEVKADENILKIIPSDICIVAHFKNKQIKSVKKGQKAYIYVDNHKFKGYVSAIEENKVKIIFNQNNAKQNINSTTKIKVKIKTH